MKKEIKLIATDLDGTLLNSDRRIVDENKKVLKALHDRGIRIVIATGRPFNGFWWIRQELGLEGFDDYCICNTGSFVRRNADGKKIVDNQLDGSDYEKISSYVSDEDLQIALYSKDILYNNADILNDGFKKDQDVMHMPRQKFESFDDIKGDIGRVNFMGDEDTLDKFFEDNKEKIEKDYMTMRNETYSLEILKKTSGKAESLQALCDYLEISTKNVMYFGDGTNDKNAISLAGIGVAMGNAEDQTKEAADFVAKTNDQAGLAEFLKEYFELEV